MPRDTHMPMPAWTIHAGVTNPAGSDQWWKLPDQLGGGVLPGRSDNEHMVTLSLPDHGTFRVPRSWLAVADPPLPPEPPVGTCVLDRDGDVWCHIESDFDHDDEWCTVGATDRLSYLELVKQFGPLTRLIPEPTVDWLMEWWNNAAGTSKELATALLDALRGRP